MKTRLGLLLAIFILLFMSSALFGKDEDNVNPADSTYMKSFAAGILSQLYDNNFNGGDWISWENFSLNDTNLGGDYLDAYDYYEEDAFVEDTIYQIHELLHYEGDTEDRFGNWTVSYGDKFITVTTSNQKKFVTMNFHEDTTHSVYLQELKIEDL
jgi:hypothetical protein